MLELVYMALKLEPQLGSGQATQQPFEEQLGRGQAELN
jgi:hypothetical protein